MPEAIDERFLQAVRAMEPARSEQGERVSGGRVSGPGSSLTAELALSVFDAQLGSRHLDLAARWLQAQGAGFYTIGSSGHEGNAAVAAALRPSDPALLHYRSGAFFLARAAQVGGQDPIRDVLLGMVAAAEDPISGGRHKVFGSLALDVIPQTSTIGSHLPRALGVAFSMARAAKLGLASPWPADAIAVASFGDASANHSTLLGAVNAACWASHQGLPVPLLLVCEDNGLGISVPTPPGWIQRAYGHRPGLGWASADGCQLDEAFDAATSLANWARRTRRPAFLHLRMVRFMAHAGSDAESAYRRPAQVAADYERDPLVATARLLVEDGALTPAQVLERYQVKRDEVMAVAAEVAGCRRLSSAREVMAPLAPHHPQAVALAVRRSAPAQARAATFPTQLPEDEGPLTLAQAINRALHDGLARYPQALVFGEDVARKGGVYGVTKGLQRQFGPARVFDTLLDEQSILGLGIGLGVAGLLPVPEIQYLAYLHNAEDQLRGEAASLRFFSSGQYRNPLVVRIAGYGYQRGFGGHFHNDNGLAVLRDVPGLVVASPARPDDAAAMLRTCLAAANQDGAVCVYLEPIALYHARDLHAEGDGGWLAPYAPPAAWEGADVPVGRGRTYGTGRDLTLVTFANGLLMSLRVAERLRLDGIDCRVLDLRWLAPLPTEDIVREANATGRVLVVDETRRSGGVSEGVLAVLVDAGFRGPLARVASEDSYVPLGPAALEVLLSEPTICRRATELMG